jgi:hypothetical protein
MKVFPVDSWWMSKMSDSCKWWELGQTIETSYNNFQLISLWQVLFK